MKKNKGLCAYIVSNESFVTKNGLRVLSLFDGIGCGRQALSELNIKVEKYYASEIDKYATGMISNMQVNNNFNLFQYAYN